MRPKEVTKVGTKSPKWGDFVFFFLLSEAQRKVRVAVLAPATS